MDKVVTFAVKETSEVWSPLSTGSLGASMAKDNTGFSPINNGSSTEEFPRPSTPTRNYFSSTPFTLSSSTSSPNLLQDKSVFAKYRSSPRGKMLTMNPAKLQEQIKSLQTQISASEQRQETVERENTELKNQVKLLKDHITRQEKSFNMRIEEAVKIEDENAALSRDLNELRLRFDGVLNKLSEAEDEVSRMNSDLDNRHSEITSLQSDLRFSQNKITGLESTLSQITADDERLSNENISLQEQVKNLEIELGSMRTKCQDKHDLLVAVERHRDALEDKLRACERKLHEAEENTLGDTISANGAAASSQMQIHIIKEVDNLVKSQLENMFDKKFSQLTQAMGTQSQNSVSQPPSAPASIADNALNDDAISLKAETDVSEKPSENIYPISQVSLDTTVTSDREKTGLGNIGSVATNPTTSTWKKPTSAVPPVPLSSLNQDQDNAFDWLPMNAEDEDTLEEEARWRDREFVKKTAIGAANRKRLIQQEESRSMPTPASQKPLPADNTNDRLCQLAERNRRQPAHMRSAYPIEESTFLVSENDLRTGKSVTVDRKTAVSSTPLHTDSASHKANYSTSGALRAPRIPMVSRPISMYVSAPSNSLAPSSIPKPPAHMSISPGKPTHMMISPSSNSRIPTPSNDRMLNSSLTPDVNKENDESKSKQGHATVLNFSPPTKKGQAAAKAKAQEAHKERVAAKADTVFYISPPQKQPIKKAVRPAASGNPPTKSTSTPKKFLGAMVRAFGSNSRNTEEVKSQEV